MPELDESLGVPELKERLELALDVAREAGQIAMRYFQSDVLVVERKTDDSPVTRADREGEGLMRARLEAACPDDAIVGEELGSKEGTSGFTWYLDPIDGTHSFVHGVPLFGVMIGLEQANTAVAGVLVFPALRELAYGTADGSWWGANVGPPGEPYEARPARVSATQSVQGASFATTGLESFQEADIVPALGRIAQSGADARSWSDCYGHYLVATGRVDAMIDPAMSVWDCAPLQPIIEGAGGRFTDLGGVATIHGGSAISTNGLLHDDVLALVAGAR